jgi:toxin FitB
VRFLLDTNVISELRKARTGRADPQVIDWASRVPVPDLFISVITVQEIETGVLLMERRDTGQGRLLRVWFEEQVLKAFAARILDIDLRVARRDASLHVPNMRPFRDALIAATALVHGMTVVTRNESDFTGTGVRVLNPWSD